MRENPKSRTSAENEGGVRQRQERTSQARPKSTRMSGRKRREGWLIPLCVILPPVGAAYMWAMQRFSMRTRVLVSLLSAIILFGECYFMFSGTAGMPDATTFTPGAGSVYAPVSVTAEPTQIPDATELPYEYVEAATQTPGDNGSAVATVDPNAFVPNTSAPDTDSDPTISTPIDTSASSVGSQDTTVYTADGSLFYHISSSCGGKDYPNAISLQDALNAGLAACNKCNPPSSIG